VKNVFLGVLSVTSIALGIVVFMIWQGKTSARNALEEERYKRLVIEEKVHVLQTKVTELQKDAAKKDAQIKKAIEQARDLTEELKKTQLEMTRQSALTDAVHDQHVR
jgi:uncharacterized protein HemX